MKTLTLAVAAFGLAFLSFQTARAAEMTELSCDDFNPTPEALERFATKDPIKAQLVELRYFVGMTGDEAAEVLGISPTTADRYWAYARAWLQAEVRDR